MDLQAVKEFMQKLVADDDLFDLMALAYKKAHDNLVKRGVPSDIAWQILAKQGPLPKVSG